jgi:hypothetical protein
MKLFLLKLFVAGFCSVWSMVAALHFKDETTPTENRT